MKELRPGTKKIKNPCQKKDFPEEVHLILIGKDGQIKNLYTKNTNLNEIFSDVDKMPMRMNEMLRKTNRD